MSSNDTAGSALPPLSQQEQNDILAAHIIQAISSGLLVIATLMSLQQEKKYIWSRKMFRVRNILYLMTRYFAIFQTVIALVVAFGESLPQSACNPLLFSLLFLDVMTALGLQGITISIIVTVTDTSRWMRVPMWVLMLIVQGTNIPPLIFSSCDSPTNPAMAIVTQINSSALILFEAGALTIVLSYTLSIYRRRPQGSSLSLIDLFIRGGIFRFTIILLWSLYGAISPSFLRPTLIGIDVSLQNAFSVVTVTFLFLKFCKIQREISMAQRAQGQFTTHIEQPEDEDEDDFEGRIGLKITDGVQKRAHAPDLVLTWQSGSASVQGPVPQMNQQSTGRKRAFDLESQTSQFSDDEDQVSSSPPRAYSPAKPRMVHASGTIF